MCMGVCMHTYICMRKSEDSLSFLCSWVMGIDLRLSSLPVRCLHPLSLIFVTVGLFGFCCCFEIGSYMTGLKLAMQTRMILSFDPPVSTSERLRYKCTSLCLACMVLRINSRVLCMLGRHSELHPQPQTGFFSAQDKPLSENKHWLMMPSEEIKPDTELFTLPQ